MRAGCTVPDRKQAMAEVQPFYLIVADYDRGVFAVEGPITDDRPWLAGERAARQHQRDIACGPAGPDRDKLAAEFRQEHDFAGVPPGTIIRVVPSAGH